MSNGTSTTVTSYDPDKKEWTYSGKTTKDKEFSYTSKTDPKSFKGAFDQTRIKAWKEGYTQSHKDKIKAAEDASQSGPHGVLAGSYGGKGGDAADPYNIYSENGDTRSDKKEDPPIEAVTLTAGSSFDPGSWRLTPSAPYVPYAPPSAQDWSEWMFGSPFGGQGGLAYQPGSQEYLEQYIPQNIWGSTPGLSEGVMAELAPSGLLEV